MPRFRALFLVLSLSVCSTAAMAGERGYFGFVPSAKMSGFKLNPTVDAVHIAKVLPGTPAARAGIAVGDAVLKVDGMDVAGQKAIKLMGMTKRDIGQTLRVELKRPDGERYTVSLVAAAKQ